MDDAVRAQVQFGKLSVGIRQLVAHRSHRLGPAAPDFGFGELEAVHRLDADAVFRTGHGIDDGLAPLLDVAGHLQLRTAPGDVHGEVDLGKYRLVHLAEHREEYG